MKKIIIVLLSCLIASISCASTTIIKKKAAAGSGFVGYYATATDDAEVTGTNMSVIMPNTPYAMLAYSSGTITYIHAYLDYVDSNSHFNVAIYNSTGTTKLAESQLTPAVSGNYTTFALDSPVTITESHGYILRIGSSDDSSWRIKLTAVADIDAGINLTGTISDTMPTTIGTPGGVSGWGRAALIHANNSPTPGVGAP